MREFCPGYIEFNAAVIHTGKQLRLRFRYIVSHSFNELVLIRHNFLKRIGHNSLTAENDFGVVKHSEELIHEIDAGRESDRIK